MSEQGVIERVGVVGCGLMGSGIAEVCARAGLDVDGPRGRRGRGRGGSAAGHDQPGPGRALRQADRGGPGRPRCPGSAGRPTWPTWPTATSWSRRSWRTRRSRPRSSPRSTRWWTAAGAILASNTSSIPIMKLGMATSRPEQVVGIHFFNPVPVLRLVEVVTSLLTSPETTERAVDLRHRRPAQAGDPLAGPGRLHRERPARPLPALGHPHAGVRASPARRTSTPGWSRAATTPWARCA